jgi:UDP-N-acetylglucosamine 2-epimerase (non-hydrolysing)
MTGISNVHLVAGARPNFMKVAPLYHELRLHSWCDPKIVHTGQHYDADLSGRFLAELRLPAPHFALGVGSGTHAQQTARVMVAYEEVCQQDRPDWVVVVGDVNSTMAAALAARKLNIRVAHLEAGLRSGDASMPEEVNRRVTDAVSTLLWTPSADADDNLRREGCPPSAIVRVGNIMIDSFEMLRSAIEAAPGAAEYALAPRGFGVVTLHRPSNVDDAGRLDRIVGTLIDVASRTPLLFAVHPRTRARLEGAPWARLQAATGLHLLEPQGYVRFMSLVKDAAFVLTDSGGVQEETSYLGIPCLTLRENTERPVTVDLGTNRLVTLDDVATRVESVRRGEWPAARSIPLWDGRTAARVAASLHAHLAA